jgi:hypothetical protein
MSIWTLFLPSISAFEAPQKNGAQDRRSTDPSASRRSDGPSLAILSTLSDIAAAPLAEFFFWDPKARRSECRVARSCCSIAREEREI